MGNAKAPLEALRLAMKDAQIDAYFIPRGDAFSGEEVQAADERLAWISGFTGSAGLAIVTMDTAILFSDGRYTLQMKNQTTGDWQCMVMPSDKPSDWIISHLDGKTLGFDLMLMTMSEHRQLIRALSEKDINVKPVADNLIDQIWQDRPTPQISIPWDVDPLHHGQDRTDKINAVVANMTDAGADILMICDPTELAWLLNIRAADLTNTPVMLAFAMLSRDKEIMIFHDDLEGLDIDQRHIHIRPRQQMIDDLRSIDGKVIWLDPAQTPLALANAIEAREAADTKIMSRTSPLKQMKAIKNSVEQDGFRSAHCRDAVAVIRFLAWLDTHVMDQTLTEIEAGEKLQSFRKQVSGYLSDSFPSISGSGAHGAIVHYRATEASNAPLRPDSLYLIDSGGQYHDATTDITRTVAIGQPGKDEIFCYTHVLKAHIALDQQIFPKGTTGIQLDAITRQSMWNAGLDYAHGTGHGVGCALGVHEGPASISPRGSVSICEGMVLSNEPGYYRDGSFGIRLENLIIVVAKANDMLGFEHVTWVPFDRRLIDVSLLSEAEREWLNHYHQNVKDKIMPALTAHDYGDGDGDTVAWLTAQTAPL